MKRLLMSVLAIAMVLAVSAPVALAAALTYPVQVTDPWPVPDPPALTAPSWLLYDDEMDAVVASKNPDEERSVASVTKIMTGLLVMEEANLAEEVVISTNAASTGEKEIDLVAGERVTVEQLFKALMIHSANDAAIALAEHIAGSVPRFVEMMNGKAAELGLIHTRFSNPHGLDALNHYSTANDLLVITKAAMEYPLFAETARSRSYVFPPAPDGTARIAQSTNLMLGEYEGMAGVKTGFTITALLTFVAAAERDNRLMYAIVLGSEGRRGHFTDAANLLDYAFDDMPYYQMISSRQPYDSPQPRVAPGPLTVARDAEAFLHIAGEGLFLDPPAPVGGIDLPESTPIVESIIERDPGPESIWDAMTFWFNLND